MTTEEAQTQVLEIVTGGGVPGSANGEIIRLLFQRENDVSRDEFGQIVNRAPAWFELHTFPVLFNPSEKQQEAAGINETVSVLFYLSRLEFIEIGRDSSRDLDLSRGRLIHRGVEYEIMKVNPYVSQFGSDYLYVTIGANRS